MLLAHGGLVRAGRFVALAAVAASLAGCAVGEPAPDVGEPAAHQVLEEFVLHLQPARRRASIERVGRPAQPGAMPQAIADVNVCQDGVPGSSDPTKCGLAAGTPTVELVTDQSTLTDSFGTGAVNGCPAGSFC